MSPTQADRIEAKLDKLLKLLAPKRPHDDSKIYRDPSPKYWEGESYTNQMLSNAPPDYLHAFARYKRACVFMARKEGDPEKMKYVDRDEAAAKLASDWAAYKEAQGEVTPPLQVPMGRSAGQEADDSEFGF